MKKVTVVICTYNRGEMLRGSIQSALNQTYRDMKIVVLDNCSTDNTREVVAGFSDPRLSYVCNETNLGGVGNLNKAFEICDTEYLNIFHDDDRMFPWMIEEEVRILDRCEDVDIVGSSNAFIMGSGDIPSRCAMNGKSFAQNELVEDMCREGRCSVICPSVMFRKKKIDSTGLFFRQDVGPACDMYLWLEANNKGLVFYLFENPLLESRVHGGRDTSSSSIKIWCSSHKHVENFILETGLNYNLDKLRAYFVQAAIALTIASASNDGIDIKSLREIIDEIHREYGWKMTRSSFNEIATVAALGECITKVGKNEMSFGDYLRKRREWVQKGLCVPMMMEFKWLLKYCLYKRYLCKITDRAAL